MYLVDQTRGQKLNFKEERSLVVNRLVVWWPNRFGKVDIVKSLKLTEVPYTVAKRHHNWDCCCCSTILLLELSWRIADWPPCWWRLGNVPSLHWQANQEPCRPNTRDHTSSAAARATMAKLFRTSATFAFYREATTDAFSLVVAIGVFLHDQLHVQLNDQ